MFFFGKHVEQDCAKGLELLQQAYSAGSADAASFLAFMCYDTGEKCEQQNKPGTQKVSKCTSKVRSADPQSRSQILIYSFGDEMYKWVGGRCSTQAQRGISVFFAFAEIPH
jgi:hypothetical protein